MKTVDELLDSGLLEAYVLGQLSPAEEQELIPYLKKYPELMVHVRSLEAPLEATARAHRSTPPSGLFDKISDRLEEPAESGIPQETAPATTTISFWPWLTAFAIMIGAISSIWFYSQQKQIKQELQETQLALETQKTDCEKQLSLYQTTDQLLALARHPNTNTYQVGDQLAVFWNTETKQSAMAYHNLPALDSDEDYQLWADVEGKMINVGVLPADGQNLQVLNFIAHAESLNITIEPKGGSEEPTVSRLVASVKV